MSDARRGLDTASSCNKPSINSLWALNLCAAIKLELCAVTSISSRLLTRTLQGRAFPLHLLQQTHAALPRFQTANSSWPGLKMEGF